MSHNPIKWCSCKKTVFQTLKKIKYADFLQFYQFHQIVVNVESSDEINRTSSSVESEYQRSLQNSAELKTQLSTKLNKLGVSIFNRKISISKSMSHVWNWKVSFKFVARYGQPARVIVTVVQEEDADLVVVGYQVQGRLQRLLTGGSIANHVTKHAHCPILVCRHKMKQKPTGWSDDDVSDDFRERRRGSERRGRRSKPRAMWETLVRTIKRE